MKFEKEKLRATVKGTFLSVNPEQAYDRDDYFVTKPVDELVLTTSGIVGDRHFGSKTVSGNRLKSLYKKGTSVRNNRQWSAISPHEIEQIGQGLDLDGRLTPELLGINIVIEGIDDLSELSPMTYLVFSPESGDFKCGRLDDVTLVVYGQALPCTIAGKALVEPFGDASLETRFPRAALGYRGTTGWVEKGGIIRPDYTVWALTPTGKD